MTEQGKLVLQRLRKPSVVLSIASQVVTLLLMLGLSVDRGVIMAVMASVCSILTALGVLSNPDSSKKGFGDDILICSKSGRAERHVLIDGKYVCTSCGAVYGESEPAAGAITG